jgi:hypothetical protein
MRGRDTRLSLEILGPLFGINFATIAEAAIGPFDVENDNAILAVNGKLSSTHHVANMITTTAAIVPVLNHPNAHSA